MKLNGFEKLNNFRGKNDKRVGNRWKPSLIVDTVDVGLFGRIEPSPKSGDPRRKFTHNQELWSELLGGSIGHGDSINLEHFQVLEWLPACPGRYFTSPKTSEFSQASTQWSR